MIGTIALLLATIAPAPIPASCPTPAPVPAGAPQTPFQQEPPSKLSVECKKAIAARMVDPKLPPDEAEKVRGMIFYQPDSLIWPMRDKTYAGWQMGFTDGATGKTLYNQSALRNAGDWDTIEKKPEDAKEDRRLCAEAAARNPKTDHLEIASASTIETTTAKEGDGLAKERMRAIGLAAALWSVEKRDEARRLWKTLEAKGPAGDFPGTIGRKMRERRFEEAFAEMKERFERYDDSAPPDMGVLNGKAIREAIDAGIGGRFDQALHYSRFAGYCYEQPNRLGDLVGAMAMMALGRNQEEWIPLLVRSSVGPTALGVEGFDGVEALDVQLLASAEAATVR